jgi:hypothetical protein
MGWGRRGSELGVGRLALLRPRRVHTSRTPPMRQCGGSQYRLPAPVSLPLLDCHNGTIALYGTPRYRCRVGGYTLIALKRLVCQTTDEVEDESHSPQTCDIDQGESICTLSTCCDWAYVYIGLVGTLPYLDRVIQDAAYGLPRIHLLRTRVNKGRRVNQSPES